MNCIDITLPLCPELAVWPGDVPYSRLQSLALDSGASVNLSSITMSLHAGTHFDAPCHFTESAGEAGDISPETGMGLAFVVDVRGKQCIGRSDLSIVETASVERILLRTDVWSDWTQFPESIPVLDLDVPEYLSSHGVRLIGIDLPSVDTIDSKTLPIHHALHDYGITILESLKLTAVAEGFYQLAALPLRIVEGDAAPARALLFNIERKD